MESLGDDDVSIVHARKYEMVRMTQRISWHLLYSHISILFCVTCVQWYSVEQLFWKLWTKRRSLSKTLESLPDTSLSLTNFLLETICQTRSFLLGQRVLCIPSVSKSNNMLVIRTIIISFSPLPPPPPPPPTHITIIVIFIVMIIFFSLFAALMELFLMDLIQVRESCAISREVCASLRSKRFQSSFFPLPLPRHIFFCSCPSFLNEPREETLATQAKFALTKL